MKFLATLALAVFLCGCGSGGDMDNNVFIAHEADFAARSTKTFDNAFPVVFAQGLHAGTTYWLTFRAKTNATPAEITVAGTETQDVNTSIPLTTEYVRYNLLVNCTVEGLDIFLANYSWLTNKTVDVIDFAIYPVTGSARFIRTLPAPGSLAFRQPRPLSTGGAPVNHDYTVRDDRRQVALEMDNAQLTAFRTFFATTVRGMAFPFAYVDGLGNVDTFRFAMPQLPPATYVAYDFRALTVSLRRHDA